MEPVNPH
jgi:hypothetical protein